MWVYIDMDSQELTDAFWTLFTCRESTEIWIRQGVLQRFRSHVDNCALLLAELEADGHLSELNLSITFDSFDSQVHHLSLTNPKLTPLYPGHKA